MISAILLFIAMIFAAVQLKYAFETESKFDQFMWGFTLVVEVYALFNVL